MSGEPDSYVAIETEVRRDFGSDSLTRKHLPSGEELLRISPVATPDGCRPTSIRVLLVYHAPSAPPEVLVDPAPTLSNGQPAANIRPKQVDGETWNDYSVQWSWNPSDSIWRNVRRKLMRFASPS